MLNMKFPKISLLVTLALFAIIGLGCSDGVQKNKTGQGKVIKQQLKLGTADIGGAYYPIGSAMADIITKNIEGVQCTAKITGGAVENPRLVHEGEVDLAMTNVDTLFHAYNGMGNFAGKYTIAPMFVTCPSVVQIVTMDDSIQSVGDLKGKRIALGPMGGGTANVFLNVIKLFGYTINDVKAIYTSFSECIRYMINGEVDAVVVQAALPSGSILELNANDKAYRIIPFDEAKIAEIKKVYPYYSGFIIPQTMYKGMDADVATICVNNVAFTRRDMPEELVYQIVAAIYENLDILKASHASTSVMDISNGWDVPIPLHPGAEKYFREQGVLNKYY